ncbi:MAG: YqeG family HAD IIIA-type phosphatase [Bacilli bacterium]
MFFSFVNFIPNDCYENVFQIDYNKLYKSGKRVILMDLDNTLIPYDIFNMNEKIEALFEEIKSIGFKLILISNNSKKRMETFLNGYELPFIYKATKPFKRGFKKALKICNVGDKREIVVIGDQLMTDVWGAKRLKLDAILVKPIKKSTEKWYTRVLRFFERKALLKIKKNDNETYLKIVSVIGEPK